MPTDERQFPIDRHLREFATLVRQLRAVQKSGGSGYKNTTVSAQAGPLEKQVDAEILRLLGKPRS